MKLMAAVMAAVVASGGCSIALQRHRDDGTWRTSLVDDHCSGSRKLPWIDMSVMVAGVATAGGVEAYQSGVFGHPHESDVASAVSMVALGTAFAFMSSALVGFDRAKACAVAPSLATR